MMGSLLYALVGIAIVLAVINQLLIFSFNAGSRNVITANTVAVAAGSGIIPAGVPRVYGQELGIKYDDVSPSNAALADATIAKMSALQTGDAQNPPKLTEEQLKRYINVASQISCEYCCGAKSIITPSGTLACYCAHSKAMRGLAEYLVSRHGSEFTDDQILEELGKWKVLFFPGIHQQKADVLEQEGIEVNYINLASNKYRGIEQGTATGSGGMVGGC